jgi:hypothetical protein
VFVAAGFALKFASPAKLAVNVLAPTLVDVRLQLPTFAAAVHVALPSLTVTFPTGVPAPGATAAVVHETVYGCPIKLGSGVSVVNVKVIFALLTTCGLPVIKPLDPLKFASPL